MTAALDHLELAVSPSPGPLASLVDACGEIAEPLRPGAAPEAPALTLAPVTTDEIVQWIVALDEPEPCPPLV